ncbi:hypothetical protein F5888DRAFT_1658199 [Russula emetica]|nr:hypothetical protein F5888DRAFT_1658199 [Russula emetica]
MTDLDRRRYEAMTTWNECQYHLTSLSPEIYFSSSSPSILGHHPRHCRTEYIIPSPFSLLPLACYLLSARMVNLHDPTVVAQDTLAVAKFWSTLDGLYLWEFITNLDYEWGIIRGHRTHNWTIWIYSFTRLATFITVVLNLFFISATTPHMYNCQLEVMFQLIFGYLSVSASSLLIVLRILAIWNKKRIVVAIAASTWGVNLIFNIQSIVRIRAEWASVGGGSPAICELLNLSVTKPNTLVTLVANIILLVIMFIGLLSNHLYESGTYSIGRLLWKQGLIWILIATISEVLPAVFICLDLNNLFDYVFQLPSVIAISIAATRMHRSLTQFAATASSNFNLPRILDSRSPVSTADRARTTVMPMAVPLSHMEVAVHKTYSRYESGPTNHHVSFVVAGGEPRNKSVAGPVSDIEEESTSAEIDADFESNAGTSNTGKNPRDAVMDITEV